MIRDHLTDRPRALDEVAWVGLRWDQRESLALTDAANNLLAKATTAVSDGDEERARRLVARALELPDDTHEELVPGLRHAVQQLFCLITDAAEASDEDDQYWIDSAEVLLPTVTGQVHGTLLWLLATVAHDAAFLGVTPAESQRLRVLAPGVTVGGHPEDQVPEGDREDYVVGLLRFAVDYKRRVAEHG